MTRKKGINIRNLVVKLKKTDRQVVKKAITDLSMVREPEQIKKLAEYLNDESWQFRQRIEDAIVAIGSDAAEVLCEMIPGSVWYVRSNAVSALGRIGVDDPHVVKIISDLLNDASSTVKKSAENALLAIIDQSNISDILSVIEKDYGPEFAKRILELLNQKKNDLYQLYLKNGKGTEPGNKDREKSGLS